jgi:hypothetical protein
MRVMVAWLARRKKEIAFFILVAVLARVLATVTVVAQQEALGMDFLQGKQTARHRQILAGEGGNPWQYRILPHFLIEWIKPLYAGKDHPLVTAFLELRLGQNFLIFLIAAIHYHRLRLSKPAILLGVNILAWSMTRSLFDSDLRFSTYVDVLLYLIAGVVFQGRTYRPILPLTVAAAFNRETSALIPFFPPWQPSAAVIRQGLWAKSGLTRRVSSPPVRAYLAGGSAVLRGPLPDHPLRQCTGLGDFPVQLRPEDHPLEPCRNAGCSACGCSAALETVGGGAARAVLDPCASLFRGAQLSRHHGRVATVSGANGPRLHTSGYALVINQRGSPGHVGCQHLRAMCGPSG